jgi:hypothetical protein
MCAPGRPRHDAPPGSVPRGIAGRGQQQCAGRLRSRIGTQRVVYPLFGIATTLATDAVIALLFTLVSLARSYLLRRVFERFDGRAA